MQTTLQQLTSLCLLLSFLLELLQLLLVLGLNLQLHLGQLNLIVVFGLGDLILQRGAVVLPLESFEVVYSIFTPDIIISVHILSDLTQGDLSLFQLQIGSLTQLIVRGLHLLD